MSVGNYGVELWKGSIVSPQMQSGGDVVVMT